MKKLLLLPSFILLAQLVHSQWLPQPPNNSFVYYLGSVGIGTSSPQSTLHVVGQTMGYITNAPAFVSESNLGVVIQQANLGNDFVSGQSYFSIYAHNIQFDGTNWIRRNQYSNTWATVMNYNYYDVQFALANGSQPANTVVTPSTYLRILPSGNVLIGKTTQVNSSYLLDVNGNVRANQVVVNTTGADYVFDTSYNLMPLDTLENYVRANHHLPGVASAQEMSDKGWEVGEGQTTLLKKVEELTLYVMDQQKQIEQLKEQNEKLTKLFEKQLQSEQ